MSHFHVRIDFRWGPSHGKLSLFKVHPLCTEVQMRRWNELAEEAARVCMKNRLWGSRRSLWNVDRACARQWELRDVIINIIIIIIITSARRQNTMFRTRGAAVIAGMRRSAVVEIKIS